MSPSPSEPVMPSSGRVALVGDSLAWTAGLWNGYYPGYDSDGKMYAGYRASNVISRVRADAASHVTSPMTLVVALGQNDGGDGLDNIDLGYLNALVDAPYYTSCVVLVKPHYTGTNTVRRQGIADYRAWVDRTVATNPGRVFALDWSPTAAVTPGIGSDGFHFVEGGEAARAYYDMLYSAPAVCAGNRPTGDGEATGGTMTTVPTRR